MDKKRKQAVVLIHGIGEQVPMDTLRGFVEAVWTTDAETRKPWTPGTSWSKPDQISGDFELRRLTTTENREGRRTDFFEFYWAHLMKETTLSHIVAWLKVLLFRAPSRVPHQLRGIWWTLVLLVAIAVLITVGKATGVLTLPGWLLAAGSALWVLIGGTLTGLLNNVAGDAARYLHVAPPNIAIRRDIREAGIALLEKLHSSGEYDRIILVGHSLGSVIGYDILTHLWPRYNSASAVEGNVVSNAAQKVLEKLAAASTTGKLDLDQFQAAQSAYFKELLTRTKKWLVSDFVTLGSPLAHAPVLMARNQEQLDASKADREFPTCPPTLERIRNVERFTYPEPGDPPRLASGVRAKKKWLPHHAAVFGPTRWTNLYFPCAWTLKGDVIGGPVAPVFGPGIRDVPVYTDLRGGLFSHTLYWTFPKNRTKQAPSWITELRKAVRVCEAPLPRPQDQPAPEPGTLNAALGAERLS
jgi:hypothetical protein